MGDLVQTLPALTDASKAAPGIIFDWVVDESFAQIPAWHPNVEKVIVSAFRRWGKDWRESLRSGEPQAFYEKLRGVRYDLVVDVQCILKSAITARAARGVTCGYDRRSVHEWGAHLFYQRKFYVPKRQHSMKRMRQLLSKALGYEYPEEIVDYGIDRSRIAASPLNLPKPYMAFIHSTSWTSKCWPEDYWRELTLKATSEGFHVALPWGDEPERLRAERIAQGIDKAVVLPKFSIAEKASIIAEAHSTVGLDTGLSHIAAALDIPSVTIYGATDPSLVGATGENQLHAASAFECVKCHKGRCTYPGAIETRPACLLPITPETIWNELVSLNGERLSTKAQQTGSPLR